MMYTYIISTITIIVVCFSLFIAWKTYGIVKNQEIVRLKELKKAKLSVRINSSENILYIENFGKNEARDVLIMINDTNILNHGDFHFNCGRYNYIGPMASLPFVILKSFPGGNHKITMSWNDDSGEPGLYSTLVCYPFSS